MSALENKHVDFFCSNDFRWKNLRISFASRLAKLLLVFLRQNWFTFKKFTCPRVEEDRVLRARARFLSFAPSPVPRPRVATKVWIGDLYDRDQLHCLMREVSLTPLRDETFFFRFFLGMLARRD